MNNTELMAMEYLPEPNNGKKNKGRLRLRLRDIPLRMLGFLLAGAMPISGLAPFGLSFLTIDRKFSLGSVLSLIFVSAGYLVLFDFPEAFAYISACLIFETALFVVERSETPSFAFIAAAAGVSMFLCETAALLLKGFTAAGLILALCDTLLMVVGALVFDRCRVVLLENKFLSRGLLADEKISLCVTAGIILLSTRYMTVLGLFNMSNFLAFLMIGIVTLTGRSVTRGAVSGIAAGIILGLGGNFPDYAAYLTIGGLLAGLAAKLGKKAVCAATALFGAAAMLYLGIPEGYAHLPNIYEIAAAAAVLYFIPRTAIVAADKIVDFDVSGEDEIGRFRRYVDEKLGGIADSFEEISEILSETSESRGATDMTEISLLFDTAADRVCKNCERSRYCWEKDFNATYAAMFKFLEIMERKGVLQRSDVPKAFSDKCVHLLPLISEINRLFEIYKINTTWKNKLEESRELASQQFKGISQIIENAAAEICGGNTLDIEAADELKVRLRDAGIKAERVEVICDKNQKYTVEAVIGGCDDYSVCRNKIKAEIKNTLGISVSTPFGMCEAKNGERCKIRFCQLESFEPNVGIASRSGSAESGDKHYTDYLSGGKLAVTISDGMGTGRRASLESGTIVSLLSSFLDAGFDKKIAVKLVNSIMVMKSARDVFATIDMCIIDLYTGQIEFIKNGAEPSFIKYGAYTETIRAASLPIGIVPIGDIEAFARTLENGSLVVMTSDGVTSPPEDPWIKELVECVDIEVPPKELAKIILDEAARRNKENNIENDDMTVICVRLEPGGSAAA